MSQETRLRTYVMFLGLLNLWLSLQNPLNKTVQRPLPITEYALLLAEVQNRIGTGYELGYADCRYMEPDTADMIFTLFSGIC